MKKPLHNSRAKHQRQKGADEHIFSRINGKRWPRVKRYIYSGRRQSITCPAGVLEKS